MCLHTVTLVYWLLGDLLICPLTAAVFHSSILYCFPHMLLFPTVVGKVENFHIIFLKCSFQISSILCLHYIVLHVFFVLNIIFVYSQMFLTIVK